MVVRNPVRFALQRSRLFRSLKWQDRFLSLAGNTHFFNQRSGVSPPQGRSPEKGPDTKGMVAGWDGRHRLRCQSGRQCPPPKGCWPEAVFFPMGSSRTAQAL